jgi:acetylornithine deacetylase/succinyl-diaminopimelate desuccinylase-like protein
MAPQWGRNGSLSHVYRSHRRCPAAHAALADDLIRIPSVSAAGFDPAHVRASAELTLSMLEAAGLQRARLLTLDDAHPYVAAEWLGAAGAPTVLLYAHHDVQPPGRGALVSDPFSRSAERRTFRSWQRG